MVDKVSMHLSINPLSQRCYIRLPPRSWTHALIRYMCVCVALPGHVLAYSTILVTMATKSASTVRTSTEVGYVATTTSASESLLLRSLDK